MSKLNRPQTSPLSWRETTLPSQEKTSAPSIPPTSLQEAHSAPPLRDRFEAQAPSSLAQSPENPAPQSPTYDDFAPRMSPLLRLQMQGMEEPVADFAYDPALERDPRATTKGAAQRLHQATQGAGTNEEEIVRVLRDRTTDEIAVIRDDFAGRYGVSLDQRLSEELGGKALQKATLLLQGDQISPEQRDAEWLQLAMEGTGTDEKAVLDTLYGKGSEEREAIAQAYQSRTGRALVDDLRSEHGGGERVLALAVWERGTIAPADKLRAAMIGMGTNETSIFHTLEGQTPDELQGIRSHYKELYGRDLKTDLRKELSGRDKARALALLEKGHLSGADQLRVAMAGVGCDEKAIFKVLEGKPKGEREAVVAAYNKTYGDLHRDLKKELSSDQWDEAKSLIAHGELSVAQKLNRSMRGFGTDEAMLLKTLEGLSPEERADAKDEYQLRYSKDLEKHIRSELSGREEEKALLLLANGRLNLAESLHFATAGRGADKDAIFQALQEATPEERAALEESFRARYGESAWDRLASNLSGADELKARYLLDQGTLTLPQALEVATKGAGTREDAIYDALAAASQEERDAIASDPTMMRRLRAELAPHEMDRVEALLDKGFLTRTEQLHFAMAGRGTDEDMLHKALEGLSYPERRQIQIDYQREYGGDLLDDLRSELTKREFWKAEDALAQPPRTLRERLDRAEIRIARERGSGSAVANASDAVMDMFTHTGKEIEQGLREVRHVVQQTKAGELEPHDADGILTEKEQALDKLSATYQSQKDATAKSVASVATMSVAAATTVATAGMATLPAAALIAATTGVTRVASKQLVTGDSYDAASLEGLQDLVVGAGQGLSYLAMGKASDAAMAAIGKQVLAAQGTDVSSKGLMVLGREALRESGQPLTRELVDKAAHEALVKAGNSFCKRSLLHSVAGGALRGAVKGSVYSGVQAATRSVADEETWEQEFFDALHNVLSDTGDAAVSGARNWALALAALQIGGHVNTAMMTRLKHHLGEKLAGETAFSQQELLKAGYKALGDEANGMTTELIQAAGRDKMLVEMGANHLDSTLAGRHFQTISENLLKRGSAAFTRTLIKSLDDHDVWRDGLGEVVEKLWTTTSKATLQDTAKFGTKDVAMGMAKDFGVVRSGSPTDALLSNLVWRSISAGVK